MTMERPMTTITDEAEPVSRSPTAAIADYLRQTISVSYILGQIWSGRWLIAACFAMGLCVGVYNAWTGSARYIATMRVLPAESDLSGGDNALSGATGLLAGLTGGANVTRVPKFTQFTMGLSSVAVADLLNKRYDMLCLVFRDDCDLATHTWRERTGWRNQLNGFFAWLGHLPNPNGARTTTDLATYIAGSVKVEQSKQSAVATLSFINRDPKFARQFLLQVFNGTNDFIKQQNRDVQRSYVNYLTAAAGKATNVEQRQAIDTLLLQTERQLMLTEVDVPYAAQIMDGPNAAPIYDTRRTLAINALIGMLIGGMLATCRNLVPRRWRFW